MIYQQHYLMLIYKLEDLKQRNEIRQQKQLQEKDYVMKKLKKLLIVLKEDDIKKDL